MLVIMKLARKDILQDVPVTATNSKCFSYYEDVKEIDKIER